MILFKYAKDLQAHLSAHKKASITVGFVPTMGALHQGHLSLIAESLAASDVTICSIFVNPVQFNNKEDFQKYPVTIENDILLLEESGCDILFMPHEDEIYPDEASKRKHYDVGDLENILEGKYRPGHFQGVCLVMDKLLHIVMPGYLFLGQKDYQQCLVIKKLIGLLKMNIKVVVCPVIREESGLAMSSRNMRLNDEDRQAASLLYQTLQNIKANLPVENFALLKEKVLDNLEHHGFTTDYLELAHSDNLHAVGNESDCNGLIILIASFIKNVRLIDNIIL